MIKRLVSILAPAALILVLASSALVGFIAFSYIAISVGPAFVFAVVLIGATAVFHIAHRIERARVGKVVRSKYLSYLWYAIAGLSVAFAVALSNETYLANNALLAQATDRLTREFESVRGEVGSFSNGCSFQSAEPHPVEHRFLCSYAKDLTAELNKFRHTDFSHNPPCVRSNFEGCSQWSKLRQQLAFNEARTLLGENLTDEEIKRLNTQTKEFDVIVTSLAPNLYYDPFSDGSALPELKQIDKDRSEIKRLEDLLIPYWWIRWLNVAWQFALAVVIAAMLTKVTVEPDQS